jgi:hypothetical protein
MADLQTLVNAIPGAQDGDIITAACFNTIKAALIAIANELGTTTPATQTGVRTLQPNFLTIAGGTAWVVTLGAATSAAGSNGFVSVDLPDGAVIQQMTVMGVQTSPAAKGFAALLVLPVTGTATSTTNTVPNITTLIQIDLSTGGNPFTLSSGPTPSVSGLSASALTAMLTVQNQQFKYAVQCEVAGASVQINTVQITYSTAS